MKPLFKINDEVQKIRPYGGQVEQILGDGIIIEILPPKKTSRRDSKEYKESLWEDKVL